MTVDYESAEPVWRQVAGFIRSRIEGGEWAPGKVIASEAAMVQEYGVARETVRKAVRSLADDGVLVVVQGKGSYVAER